MRTNQSETQRPKEVSAALQAAKTVELDVRPILNAGGEPFGKIMEAVDHVPAEGALRLLATFKPTPLFHVLGKQGWSHWIESGEGDQWAIWFYRHEEKKEMPLQAGDADLGKRLRTDGETWHLDVKLLPPPEPMTMTLSVLERLPRGISLIQENERIPQFLFPILDERGFRYEILQKDGSAVRTRIWRG